MPDYHKLAASHLPGQEMGLEGGMDDVLTHSDRVPSWVCPMWLGLNGEKKIVILIKHFLKKKWQSTEISNFPHHSSKTCIYRDFVVRVLAIWIVSVTRMSPAAFKLNLSWARLISQGVPVKDKIMKYLLSGNQVPFQKKGHGWLQRSRTISINQWLFAHTGPISFNEKSFPSLLLAWKSQGLTF